MQHGAVQPSRDPHLNRCPHKYEPRTLLSSQQILCPEAQRSQAALSRVSPTMVVFSEPVTFRVKGVGLGFTVRPSV